MRIYIDVYIYMRIMMRQFPIGFSMLNCPRHVFNVLCSHLLHVVCALCLYGLCASFSLCYVQDLSMVCAVCTWSLQIVVCAICHEPRRFAPSVPRLALYRKTGTIQTLGLSSSNRRTWPSHHHSIPNVNTSIMLSV